MSFQHLFDRLRDKRPVPPLLPDYVQDSPANWNAGDVAVCITGPPWITAETLAETTGPALGDALSVVAVNILEGRQFLWFGNYSGWYAAVAFEKLRGDKLEKCEPEFVTLLKRVRVTASGIEARKRPDPKGLDLKGESPVASGETPNLPSGTALT